VTQALSVAEGKGWREMVLTPACLPDLGNSLTIRSQAPFALQVASISQESAAEGAACSF
jgi:beta-glucosidase